MLRPPPAAQAVSAPWRHQSNMANNDLGYTIPALLTYSHMRSAKSTTKQHSGVFVPSALKMAIAARRNADVAPCCGIAPATTTWTTVAHGETPRHLQGSKSSGGLRQGDSRGHGWHLPVLVDAGLRYFPTTIATEARPSRAARGRRARARPAGMPQRSLLHKSGRHRPV